MMIIAGKVALIGAAVFFAGMGGVATNKREDGHAKTAFALALFFGLTGAFI